MQLTGLTSVKRINALEDRPMENIQIEAQRRNNMEYRKRLKILKSIRQDEKILHRYHWHLIKILENGKTIGKYNS